MMVMNVPKTLFLAQDAEYMDLAMFLSLSNLGGNLGGKSSNWTKTDTHTHTLIVICRDQLAKSHRMGSDLSTQRF